jgi:hypothetical protein
MVIPRGVIHELKSVTWLASSSAGSAGSRGLLAVPSSQQCRRRRVLKQ